MSNRVRFTPQINMPITLSLVLLAALAASTLAHAAPLAQPFIPIYRMVVSPDEITLCVGEEELVSVWVPLEVNTQMKHLFYFGERVNAEISDPQVVEMNTLQSHTGPFDRPNRRQLGWLSRQQPTLNDPSNMDAIFIIRALKKGVVTITFTHSVVRNTGSARAESKAINVEVIDCYEAFQWGQGYDFPVKDICDLERPFVLEATTDAVQMGQRIERKSVALFFWPFPPLVANGPLTGKYIYVSLFTYTVTAPDGTSMKDSGTTVAGGDYLVVMHGQGLSREGDFQLIGTLTDYHDNGFVLTGEESTLIAFKPLPEGAICSNPIQPRTPGP